MVRRTLIGFLLLCSVCLMSPVGANAQTPPDQAAAFVTDLGKQAFKVLSSKNTDLSAREAEVRRLLKDNFALAQIGKFVLGRTWNSTTDDQKREYLGLFAEYVLVTYTRRLGGYSGETFKIVHAESIGDRDAIVWTEIDRPNGQPLKAGWRVRQMNGKNYIVDVVVEGVSMIATQRAEFASIIKAQGMEGLLQTLRLQVSKYPAQAS